MQIFTALLTGLLFGFGLILSGMANPAKVISFLDITGQWDPSLALVMAGAIVVSLVAFAIAKRRRQSILGLPLQLPSIHHIDHRLILGSTLFGIGWGIAGFCPGPALVAIGMGESKAFIFVLSMLIGMVFYEVIERRKQLR